MTTYPLKRFNAVYGNGDEDAQAYGPGAFCWTWPPDGSPRQIEFLTPRKWYPGGDDARWIPESVPVQEGAGVQGVWGWDGDWDNPRVNPSILCKQPDGNGGWREVFHGFIRNGQLEVNCREGMSMNAREQLEEHLTAKAQVAHPPQDRHSTAEDGRPPGKGWRIAWTQAALPPRAG